MQLKQAVESAYQTFLANDVPSPRLNAELLLLFVLGRERAYLYAHPERELTQEEQERFEEVVQQRSRGCPTQYITGHQEFWGLDLMVSPAVLVPRPETEHVVETVLELMRKYPSQWPRKVRMVDVGTGSGCIALAVASEATEVEMHACDISEEALEMARLNAARLALGSRVLFRKSDLLDVYLSEENAATAVPSPAGTPSARLTSQQEDGQFDFVISNPPYVGELEWDKVQRQVREFEPRIAVFSGQEGLDIYRQLAPQAQVVLRPGGWLVIEIGFSTEAKVKELLSTEAGWSDLQTTADLQGIPRVIAARKMA